MDEKGITKSKLAKGISLPYSTLSGMLTRHPKNVNYGIISRIAEYLEVNTDYLLYENASFLEDLEKYAFNKDNSNSNKNLDCFIENFNLANRTIKHININVEYVYDNDSRAKEQCTFYNSNLSSTFWTLLELIFKMAIQDNEKEREFNLELISDTMEQIKAIKPPYDEEKGAEIELLRSDLRYRQKLNNNIKIDILNLQRRINSLCNKNNLPF